MHSRKNIMFSSEARFKDPAAGKHEVPGPGHYAAHTVHGNFLKQVCLSRHQIDALAAGPLGPLCQLDVHIFEKLYSRRVFGRRD